MAFIILMFTLVTVVTSSLPSKQYRSDYVYNSKTDAFYKLHIESAAHWQALADCEAEGAELMKPESEQDLIQVHSMFKKFPDLGNFVMIGSGGLPPDSAEETPMVHMENELTFEDRRMMSGIDVVNREAHVETYTGFQDLPFVCKVEAKKAVYNKECDVYGKDYVSKISTTGSCYRIATKKANWNEAYANCQAEGAHLAILNNEGEFEVVKNMVKSTSMFVENWQFFVGIRAEKTEPRVFKTVFNQTLEEVGYAPWDDNEPNNEYGVEYCVSVLRTTGKYNDTVCRNRYSYICEKERQFANRTK